MKTVLRTRILDRDQAIDGLTRMRQEWEETGCDLVDVKVSVGLLLGDAAELIGPTPEEQRAALGEVRRRLELTVPDGFALTPYDEAFAAALAAFADGRRDLRNALRALARERAKPGRGRR